MIEIGKIISYILILFFGISTIIWIDNLEKNKCKCSEDIRRSYIKNWWIFLISWNTLILGLHLVDINLSNNNIMKGLLLLLSFINLIAIFVSLAYIIKLRKSNCTCSSGSGQNILLSYDIIVLLLLGFSLLFGLFFVLSNIKRK